MNNHDEKLFHSYLTNSLPPEGRLHLESAIQNDPKVNEDFNHYQIEYFLKEKLVADELKIKCKASINRFERKRKRKAASIGLIVRGMVASALVVLGVYFLQNNNQIIKMAEKQAINSQNSHTIVSNNAQDSNLNHEIEAAEKQFAELDKALPLVHDSMKYRNVGQYKPKQEKENANKTSNLAPVQYSDSNQHNKKARSFAITTQKTFQPEVVIIRGEPQKHATSALDQAKVQYIQKNYTETFQLLKEVPASQARQASYLRGHAFFATGAYQEAYLEFQIATQSMLHKKEAQWYALLSLIAGGQNNLEILDTILSDEKHPYIKEARIMEGKLFEE